MDKVPKLPKISLEEFAEALQRERIYGYFVSGLIIRKNQKSPDVSQIIEKMPDSVVIEISKDKDDTEILKLLKEAFEKKKWLVFHLVDGSLSPLWREQLTRLRDSNSVFVQGKNVESTFFANQPEEMRVIAIINEENIKNINYPEFLNLFGPIIEI